MRRALFTLLLCSLYATAAGAAADSEYFIAGSPADGAGPAAFETLQRCEGGANDGKSCTGGGDCSGGTCVVAKYPMCLFQTRPGVIRLAQQRTTTGSAVDAFSSAQAPCDQVRILNWSTNPGPIYIGYSGVTSSTGVRIDPGGAFPLSTTGQDCNSVKVICATADTGCSTPGYKFSSVTP